MLTDLNGSASGYLTLFECPTIPKAFMAKQALSNTHGTIPGQLLNLGIFKIKSSGLY